MHFMCSSRLIQEHDAREAGDHKLLGADAFNVLYNTERCQTIQNLAEFLTRLL